MLFVTTMVISGCAYHPNHQGIIFTAVVCIVVMFPYDVDCRDEYTKTQVFWRTASSLTEVPADIPSEALEVRLDQNQITRLPANVFTSLPNCEVLNLERNIISNIEGGAFNGLVSLKTLHLSWNRLHILGSNMFERLEVLEQLNLSQNNINFMEAGTFSVLQSLKELILSSNSIGELRPEIFQGLVNLEGLNLQGNQLKKIPHNVFAELNNLKILYLNANRLTEIGPGSLQGLSSLEILALHSNLLTTMEQGVFRDVPRPLQFSLGTTVGSHVNNPLRCDSRLCWLKDEEEQGTIEWRNNRQPVCVDGQDWEAFTCVGGHASTTDTVSSSSTTATTTTAHKQEESDKIDGSTMTAIIVVSVIGAVLMILVVIIVIIWYLNRNKKQDGGETSTTRHAQQNVYSVSPAGAGDVSSNLPTGDASDAHPFYSSTSETN